MTDVPESFAERVQRKILGERRDVTGPICSSRRRRDSSTDRA